MDRAMKNTMKNSKDMIAIMWLLDPFCGDLFVGLCAGRTGDGAGKGGASYSGSDGRRAGLFSHDFEQLSEKTYGYTNGCLRAQIRYGKEQADADHGL